MPERFFTPQETTLSLLKARYVNLQQPILEPAVGDGAILKAIENFQGEIDFDCIDVVKTTLPNFYHQSFLLFTAPREYKTVITNPPFSLAELFIRHARKIAPNATLIFLLRLAFLESQKRIKFWQEFPLSELYILSKRPSFTGFGTDSCAYAWFVWKPERAKYGMQLIRTV